jgi:hypothetical protein
MVVAQDCKAKQSKAHSSLMMKAARTSETSSVDNYFTRQHIPEDNSELHTRRRENLKSHKAKLSRYAMQAPRGKGSTGFTHS